MSRRSFFLLSLFVVVCASSFNLIGDEDSRYGRYLNCIKKTQSYILASEGKPDSIYVIENQGIIIDYIKTERSDKGVAYNRETEYFFYYDAPFNKPVSTTLIDTCFHIEIIEPKAEAKGWIDYLDKKYTKRKIIDGSDEDGSVGSYKEWRYSKITTIYLSADSQKMNLQLDVKRTFNEIYH